MSEFTQRKALDSTLEVDQRFPLETPASKPPNPNGFLDLLSIDPRAAVLTMAVDLLAFGGDIISMGLLYPVEILGGVMLTFLTYKIQRVYTGDTKDQALIKALAIGMLTAIPTPITPIFAGPAGVLGLIRIFRKKH